MSPARTVVDLDAKNPVLLSVVFLLIMISWRINLAATELRRIADALEAPACEEQSP